MLCVVIWDVDGIIVEIECDGYCVVFNCVFVDCGLVWDWDVLIYGYLLWVLGGCECLLVWMELCLDVFVIEVGCL